jgi:hypothetical protein
MKCHLEHFAARQMSHYHMTQFMHCLHRKPGESNKGGYQLNL